MSEPFLLPLGEYATEPEEKNTCVWPLEKGKRAGQLCGWKCTFGSDEYCSAHLLTSQRRELIPEVKTPVNTPVLRPISLDEAYRNSQVRKEIPKDIELSPQEIQHNVEQLKRLDLLNNMMDLLKISFK